MADALALRVIVDGRWPEGTTFRLPPGCDLRIGDEHDFEISLGRLDTPPLARRQARVTATKAGGFEIRSDRMSDEIFIDDKRTYRAPLARGQRIALGASRLEVIDAVEDRAKMRGCPACGAPLDFLPRPLPGCAGCDACRALIRVYDGDARRPPHLRFREGSGASSLEWVASGARLRIESAMVRWLVVHVPVTETRETAASRATRARPACSCAAPGRSCASSAPAKRGTPGPKPTTKTAEAITCDPSLARNSIGLVVGDLFESSVVRGESLANESHHRAGA